MRTLSPLCVYCGSAPGADPAFMDSARKLGHAMGRRGAGLVYGGGRRGLMGAVAEAVLASGCPVYGVITKALVEKELAFHDLPDLRVVDTMHERKKAMADLAKGFVALPGGVGTLDELAEILAWLSLGLHDHPVGVLNVRGFFDPLIEQIARMHAAGFLRITPAECIAIDEDPDRLLDRMAALPPPRRGGWAPLP